MTIGKKGTPTRVAGLDPALRNFGVAVLEIVDGKLVPVYVCTLKTRYNKKDKFGNLTSGTKIASELYDVLEKYHVTAVAAEIPSGAISSAAAWSLGVATGIVSSLIMLDIKVYPVTPFQVKAVTGSTKATKSKMVAWARKQYPTANMPKTVQAANHIADALAVATAVGAGALSGKQRG